MDKFLKPRILDVDPNSLEADKAWLHWYKQFSSFLEYCKIQTPGLTAANELDLLIAHVSMSVYQYFSDIDNFAESIAALRAAYIKPKISSSLDTSSLLGNH